MPVISVIIATHSRPHLLPRAVESAHTAGEDIEVIVVDDASHDETQKVCRSLPRITYVRVDRNQHTAGARNLGIIASTGKYLTFLDDDDLRLPSSLDRQVQRLREEPSAGFIYGPVYSGDKECKPTGPLAPVSWPEGDIFWGLLGRCFIPALSVVFRRECLFRVGLLNKAVSGIDDWDLWVRIAELYPVLCTSDPVGIWRSPTAGSGQGTSAMWSLLARMARHQRELLELPRASQGTAEQRSRAREELMNWISDSLICTAQAWLANGNGEMRVAGKSALRNLFGALRLNPGRAFRPRTFKLLGYSLLHGYLG